MTFYGLHIKELDLLQMPCLLLPPAKPRHVSRCALLLPFEPNSRHWAVPPWREHTLLRGGNGPAMPDRPPPLPHGPGPTHLRDGRQPGEAAGKPPRPVPPPWPAGSRPQGEPPPSGGAAPRRGLRGLQGRAAAPPVTSSSCLTPPPSPPPRARHNNTPPARRVPPLPSPPSVPPAPAGPASGGSPPARPARHARSCLVAANSCW